MPDPRPDVTVLTSGHDVADARLHREVAALGRAGLQVEVLGLGAAKDGPAGVRVVTEARGGPRRRAWRSLVLPLRARGRVLVTLDPDVVPSALVVARVSRRPLVVDMHEDYARLLEDRSWTGRGSGLLGAAARALVSVATTTARWADLTVVADDQVPPQRAAHRLVVRNLPDRAFLPAPSARVGFRAVYVGDLRASRGLIEMIRAVALAPAWTLDLVGPVSAEDRDQLAAELALGGLDLAARVRMHGRLPPARSWRVAAGASVGMVLLADTPAFTEAVPSKLYEYLACGLAVVASPLPRQAEIVRGSGAGVVVTDAAQAADVLNAWAADPAALEACRDAAVACAAELLPERTGYDELADAVAALAGRSPVLVGAARAGAGGPG